MNKRQKRAVGSIAKIKIEIGFVYTRILEHGEYAFYEILSNSELNIDDIISKPILFFAAVDKYAISKGRWQIIGIRPLEIELLAPPPVYIKDPFDENKFRIYYQDGSLRPASREECIGLEQFGVWSPEQIEERLTKYFSGDKSAKYNKLLIE